MEQEKCVSCGSTENLVNNSLTKIQTLLQSLGFELTIFINFHNLEPIYLFKKLDTQAAAQINDKTRLVDFLGGILYAHGYYLIEKEGKLNIYSLEEMNNIYSTGE